MDGMKYNILMLMSEVYSHNTEVISDVFLEKTHSTFDAVAEYKTRGCKQTRRTGLAYA